MGFLDYFLASRDAIPRQSGNWEQIRDHVDMYEDLRLEGPRLPHEVWWLVSGIEVPVSLWQNVQDTWLP